MVDPPAGGASPCRGRSDGSEPDRLEDDVLEGLDRGDLPAQRFRHIAATGLWSCEIPSRAGGYEWAA